MHDAAAIVLAGEKPEAAAADVAVERQGEVVLPHELLPKLLAVVAASCRIGVRVPILRLALLGEVVAGVVVVQIGVGDENRLPLGIFGEHLVGPLDGGIAGRPLQDDHDPVGLAGAEEVVASW